MIASTIIVGCAITAGAYYINYGDKKMELGCYRDLTAISCPTNSNYDYYNRDSFSSYPTIFNGKSSCEVQCYARYKDYHYGKRTMEFNSGNPSHPSLDYGWVPGGSSNQHCYRSLDNGLRVYVSCILADRQYRGL